MAGIMVPKARAETPVGSGKDTPFPEGGWIGTLEDVRVRTFPEWIDPTQNRGYASKDGEIVSIQLGENTGIEVGQAEVGARKFFVDFVTRDGDVAIEAGPDIPEASWQMSKDAAMLANLAAALGATEEVEFNGETYVQIAEGFLDQLRDGTLSGTRVGFTTFHRNWTSKTGKNPDGTPKKGTEVKVREFFQAV